MSKNIKPSIQGHVVYPYTPIIKEIFLEDIPSNEYDVYSKGKFIVSQQISKTLREMLIKKGFSFVRTEKNHVSFRTKVFGVSISGNKVMEGLKIKELVIQIPGKTHDEVSEKTKVLLSGVQSITKTDCKIETWDKLERC